MNGPRLGSFFMSNTNNSLTEQKDEAERSAQEKRDEAMKLHSQVMRSKQDNDFGFNDREESSVNKDSEAQGRLKLGSFQLFNTETLHQYIKDPIPHRLKDVHEKILQHSGYVEPRILPAGFERIMDEMDSMYPHFAEVNKYLRQRLRLYSLQKNPVLHFGSNILLDGPAGVGKSSYLFELGQKFGTLFHSIACAQATNGFDLTGMSAKWNASGNGHLHDLIFNQECPNPIILLDEVEKSATDGSHPISKIFYGLLEHNNARFFKDEFVQVPMDASLVNWVGTCNNVDHLDAPLRDRFEVLSVKAPSRDDLQTIIPNLYKNIVKRHKLEEVFAKRLSSKVVENLAMSHGISLRRINSTLETALSNAAHRSTSKDKVTQRIRLQMNDVPMIKAEKDGTGHPIGFTWG